MACLKPGFMSFWTHEMIAMGLIIICVTHFVFHETENSIQGVFSSEEFYFNLELKWTSKI